MFTLLVDLLLEVLPSF